MCVTMRRDKASKFFSLAQTHAQLFSKDPHRKVAALFIDPQSYSILSTGYNGFCRNVEDRPERWKRPDKYTYICHAEMNAIFNACRKGVRLEGSVVVVTMFPCLECAKAITQVGATAVVTAPPNFEHERWGKQFKMANDIFQEVGMHMVYITAPSLPE